VLKQASVLFQWSEDATDGTYGKKNSGLIVLGGYEKITRF
jgi:hypothetical protein